MLVTPEMIDRSETRLPDEVRARLELTAAVGPAPPIAAPPSLAHMQSLSADGERPSRLDYERIMGASDMLDLNWFERGLVAASAICHLTISLPGGGRAYATGFMVAPGLLLTNNHVLHDPAEAAAAIATFNYELDVDGRPKPTSRFRLAPDAFFFTDPALDFSLVAVGSPDNLPDSPGGAPLASFGWLRMIPSTGKILENEWMTIVQHPSNEPKQVAARENQLIKLDDPELWYNTDTAPGSSGAPVFNDTWQVVALHHSGVPAKDAEGRWLGPDGAPAPPNPSEAQVKWIANAGMRVSRIVARIEAAAPPSPFKDAFLHAANGDPPVKTAAVAVLAKQIATERAIQGATPTAPPPQPPAGLTLSQSDGRLTLVFPPILHQSDTLARSGAPQEAMVIPYLEALAPMRVPPPP